MSGKVSHMQDSGFEALLALIDEDGSGESDFAEASAFMGYMGGGGIIDAADDTVAETQLLFENESILLVQQVSVYDDQKCYQQMVIRMKIQRCNIVHQ